MTGAHSSRRTLARSLTLALAGLCLVAVCVLAGLGSVASAAVTHNYLFGFSEVPAGPGVALPGPFSSLSSMTVDSGHLWIAEVMEGEGNGGGYRVDEFDAATGDLISQPLHDGGNPEPAYLGVALGHASGETQLYVGEYIYEGVGPAVGVYDENGTKRTTWTGAEVPGGAFGGGYGFGQVAIDQSTSLSDWAAGDVYVPDPADKVVDVFRPEAGDKEKYVTQLTGIEPGVPFSSPRAVALDPVNGDVLVADENAYAVEDPYAIDVFEPTLFGEYVFVRQLTATPHEPFEHFTGVAVDGANGDIYAIEGEVGRIFQFNAEGVYLDSILGTPEGSFNSSNGGVTTVAVDPATEDVYVGARSAHSEGAVDVFGPTVIVPDVVTEDATSLAPTSARLNGTVNPDGEGEATCQFVWGTTANFGEKTACSASVPNGSSPVAVHADITGLEPDITYHYRLQASNGHGTNVGEAVEDREFTTPGPGIRQEWTSSVASSSSSLNARIDPNGAPTTYYTQYGTTSNYGSEAPAGPGVAIGSGHGEVEVSQHLQSLETATTYHYRFVAVSELSPGEVETFYGPDLTFSTQPASSAFALPDGRAWEMVSPPDKQAAALESAPAEWGGLIQAATGGNAISYIASAPTEDEPQGNLALERVQLFSSRGASGWSTKVITTHHDFTAGLLLGDVSEYKLFSDDLSLGVVQPEGDTPLSEETSERTPYLRHDSACESEPASCYQPLVNAGNTPPGTKFGGHPENELGAVSVDGASPDLSHVILQSEVALTTVPLENGGPALYEWTAGRLQPISYLPSDEGGALVAGGLAQQNQTDITNDRGAVSDDGSKVVWQGEHGLYQRDMATEQTVRLDVPESGAIGGSVGARFQIASGDGAKVFFTDTARLTRDATATQTTRDLYEYDDKTGRLTDLTVDENKGSADVGELVTGASDDGSYVYFVANGVLAPGAAQGHCKGVISTSTETCNLYVRHAGVTRLVAILSGDDTGMLAAGPAELTARVSPNGRWLTFMSDMRLTSYDNRDANSGARDEEVYLYDASASRLTCASCDPTGARPVGVYETGAYPGRMFDHLFTWKERWLAAAIPGWYGVQGAFHQPRYLFDNGRLFFDSNDALESRDTNGAWDVYQYEPEGVGSCDAVSATFSTASGGCVDLISSGGSAEESDFADASENGDDVFFLTASQLTPRDYDHGLDLYDARMCSSQSPCLQPPPVAPPPCTTGDSCKAAPSPQPESFGAPSSETFSGVGNAIVAPRATARAKSLTRAQRLARALKACRKKKGRHRRAACERKAHRAYGKKANRKPAAGRNTPAGR